jgi:hypothetical protein
VANRAITTPSPIYLGGYSDPSGLAAQAAIMNMMIERDRLRRMADDPWFADRFADWVQTNLNNEAR